MRFVAAVGGCFEPSLVIVMAVLDTQKEVCMSSSRNDCSPEYASLFCL